MMMTKEDIVKKLRLEDKGEVDYALPQQWLNDIVAMFGFDYGVVRSSFVTFYPNNEIYGADRIYPLTPEAAGMLWTIEHGKP